MEEACEFYTLKNKGKCLYDIRNYSLLSKIKLVDI